MKLLDEISDFEDLNISWRSVPKTTSGEDGLSIDQFKSNVIQHLKNISSSLKNGTYKFAPLQKKYIRKKDPNKKRPIHLYTVKDKIIQRSIQRAFQKRRNELDGNCLFPGMVNEVSIAYIPRTLRSKDISGVIGSTKLVKKYFDDGLPVVTSMDIESFFDRIDLKLLTKFIGETLGNDHSIDWILEQFYFPEVIKSDYEEGPFSITKTGLKQGSILAPLFSNIFLMKFDAELTRLGIKAIRYADDIAIFSKDENQAKKDIDVVKQALLLTSKLDFYTTGDKKPTTLNLRRHAGVEFLGIRYELQKDDELVKMPISEKIEAINKKITDNVNRKDLTFTELIILLNTSIKGWYLFYQSLDCHKYQLNQIYKDLCSHYEREINRLLIKKQITKSSLSRKKLQYLGVKP